MLLFIINNPQILNNKLSCFLHMYNIKIQFMVVFRYIFLKQWQMENIMNFYM